MMTIKEIVEAVAKNENENRNLWHYLGNFLDYFYRDSTTTEDRLELVKEEPDEFDNIPKETYAFLAGAVHFICVKYGVECPRWIIKEKYFLKDPYFSMNAKGDLRLVLIAESPTVFRMRNIFTSANTLDRC